MITTAYQYDNVVSPAGASKLTLTAYDPDGSLSSYWNVEFRLPDLYLGNWVWGFQLTGRDVFHVTPMNVVLNPRYIPPGWYYYFESIALPLEANREYSYSFGGKGFFRLWVIKQDTQLWFDVRDQFGNILAFYSKLCPSPSDPTGGRNMTLRVFEEGREVYRDNIGKYVPGTLFYGVGRTFSDSATFELYVNLGPLGGLGNISMSGLLYDESRLVKFKDVRSEDFTLHMPVEYFWNVSGQVREQVFIDALETVYKAMGTCLGEELQGKPHRAEVNFEWCGVAGTNFVGFGVGVARWPVHVHHGWLGVLSHELGHLYSLTPPLVYYVEFPLFGEPLATYFGIEAVAALYGSNVRLWYWGTHPGFFDYLAGDRTVSEIERMQFVFFYLHKVYGPEIHKRFAQLWANDTYLKNVLVNRGFNVNETMITLYSYLAEENLARLFQIAGYNVSEERINEGLKLIAVAVTKIPTSISVSATPTKVTVGEKVVIKGSIRDAKGSALSVPLTLTIVEPDGVTRTLYGTSAPNGTFGFEVVLNKKGRHSFVVSFGGDLTHEASKSEEVYAEAEEKKMCIIATAAYGSELDPHVQFLRSFRDNFALKSFAGSKFMDVFNAWYYSFSPSVASFISTSEALRAATRAAIYPLIGILHLGVLASDAFSFNSEVSVIVAGLVISALIGLVYFTPPTLLVLYLVGRWRGVSGISRLKPRLLLIPLAVSALLVFIAELTLSPVLMMIGSGALVLSTIALVTWTVALKVTTRFLAHHGPKL